ncbi:MAG: thiamine pyrophosphate-dependent dehydrogenase E1 component subunit alpha [Candidatus Latescibacterota bacterium]|nr:thiamine pyrophosphate-dependent dehydrogenase E1 component subunit alpha [Candidatus Latescibacterota bacterium]
MKTPGSEARTRLLRGMMRIRLIEEAIADRYAEQQMRCPVHLSIGQEGIAVGVCATLRAGDYTMSTHRAHAHYLAKGGSLKAMLGELYGKETGCCGGRGGSMHLVDRSVGFLGATPIVGSSLPVAVGTAFGSQLQGEDRVTVAFFGEGTTEEGVFAESVNFAALKRLPVVFVCENNLYSVYSPPEVRFHPDRDRVALAKAHGIAAGKGDGNDVEQVLAMTGEAVAAVRAGSGPAFLEFDTYRWREHCGPNYDNDIGYRTEEEFLAWQAQCPVSGYRSLLLEQGVVDGAALDGIEAEIGREIEAALADARQASFPSVESMAADLYAESGGL